MWQLRSLEVNGGFLPGLKLDFPAGLTCIIGPRGSGKSTLAELIRFTLSGASNAPKSRLDLLQANLGANGLVTIRARTAAGVDYTIKRAHKESATILSNDGRPLTSVDLDRGTFLPLDAYSFSEIEQIADETLGNKRRALLDELRSDELDTIELALNDHRRLLESNADQIHSTQRLLQDIAERLEDLADARSKLAALGPPPKGQVNVEYATASKQQQLNRSEQTRLASARSTLGSLRREVEALQTKLLGSPYPEIVEAGSANQNELQNTQDDTLKYLKSTHRHLLAVLNAIDAADTRLGQAQQRLATSHALQAEAFARLAQLSETAGALIRERVVLEQQVTDVEQLEKSRSRASKELQKLFDARAIAKAKFLSERERVSAIRQSIAEELEIEAGPNVRIRVMRHGDDLAYRQALLAGLKGARVRNHDEILAALLTLRPEHLAQLITQRDVAAFDELMTFGPERSARILDSFAQNIDPLELEITPIEDRIRVELNVSTNGVPNYKDASELSRGQKCTALLPLLLARRNNPLVIDQPEDNLDNHFIYETIVNSIGRLKSQRQMVFITHNANIPVLAEADLVVVMNSDGKVGYVEKRGGVDQCRDEIIDLLEGGEEAFSLRSQRYARR